MRLISALVLCAGMACLISCAGPNEMRKSGPSLELRSSHPSKKVAVCIAGRWENLGIFGTTIPITMRPTEAGFTVSSYNETWGKTDLLADVIDVKDGSETRLFKSISMTERFEKAARECQ